MIKTLQKFGEYLRLMSRTFSVPDRWSEFFRQTMKEMYKLGVDSIWIVIFISIFIGAVLTIQVSLNIKSPIIPNFTVGYITREVILLEFSSSIMCLILAGKVGSNVASELGTMRVTEQIDALEMMGVNSANYLILPKIAAFVLFIPILVIFSMFFGIGGGYFIGWATDIITVAKYEYGIQFWFNPDYIGYSIEKSMVFAFIIVSVASYFGYNVKGGALEVGKASTDSVVLSSVMILAVDLVMTQLMLG
ncbi:MAG: putative phospholipid ABC transporter permease protein MlaE [Candidatus Ordinivivax streblomastigis]|uniref:Putative phospholipid ABC transporter permease protein MlaE n=1 Tax=Candidatus Ordinivivax streblomastigis TaxID=2540710 RepID=A0A5M8NZH0_9BACT|nr:MAG: putative phospholipid ABC transporter permease protein MlaE [Candidatus Ordinivivax streblomastigis]